MAEAEHTEILVIGAGIIGVTAALALQAEGRKVRILDRTGVAAGTSVGNARGLRLCGRRAVGHPGDHAQGPQMAA